MSPMSPKAKAMPPILKALGRSGNKHYYILAAGAWVDPKTRGRLIGNRHRFWQFGPLSVCGW